MGIVKLKQRCRDLVWWPGIDRELEQWFPNLSWRPPCPAPFLCLPYLTHLIPLISTLVETARTKLGVSSRTGLGTTELEALVRDCAPCLLSGKTGAPALPHLQPVDWPTKPWEHLQMDICGELVSVPHHQRFLVVVYDLHSNWPEIVPMGSVTASAMVDFLEQLFLRWVIPWAITTDNGPQFISNEFSSYLATRGVAHIHITFYHPQGNDGVERFNQSLKNGIRAHLAQGFPFKAALSQTLLHYRATQHATTGVSPDCNKLSSFLSEPLQVKRQGAHPLCYGGKPEPTYGPHSAATKSGS